MSYTKAYNTLRNHAHLHDKKTHEDKPGYQNKPVISTHSNHVIKDLNFKDLRYFRRNDESELIKMDHTFIENLSYIFSNAIDELKFVRKNLKLTHCDVFFADGVIFVEGQAERLLVPEFIAQNFYGLSKRIFQYWKSTVHTLINTGNLLRILEL